MYNLLFLLYNNQIFPRRYKYLCYKQYFVGKNVILKLDIRIINDSS